MTDEIITAYAGARVTRLVNRDDILTRIEAALQDPSDKTHVFYLEAGGGLGKTFLAREVLRRCREGEWSNLNLLAARHEVDLYHHQAHSREGFMAAFVASLPSDLACFEAYEEQFQKLQEVKYDLRGAINELRAQQESLAQTFLEGCEQLSEKGRPVVVLDTVETLVYETDRVQQALRLGEETFSIRPWLLQEWLPRMRQAVILICGRPKERFAADLRAAIEEQPDIRFEAPPLDPFAEEDTLRYFEAVRETAEQDGNAQALKRLDAIPEETRRLIHHLTGGQPITLALMIDYYLVTGRLLPEIKMSLAQVQALSGEELAQARERVKKDIVRQFREIGRPADEAIEALAWAPKGMDAELLKRVAGLEPEEAAQILKALADPRSGLSFIKMRDKRTFLHDEMYDLMKRYILDRLPEARAEEVNQEILQYYAERIETQKEKVRQLSQLQREDVMPTGRVVLAAAPGAPEDPLALAVAVAELNDLRVEEVYYRLRADPSDGFETYCEYAEEAVTANDEGLDMQLRDEMLAFAREAFKDRDQVNGLRRGDVERGEALRWVWRHLYYSQAEDAYRLAQRLREEQADFLEEGGALVWAELDIAEGWAAAFLGQDLEATETRLQQALDTLKSFDPQSDFERWRRNVLLAKGYNMLGYFLRVRGRFRAACEAYRRALPLWRKLEREVDHAETLNNLAWANAEAGNFGRALRRCRDGLELRQELGHRYLIALSFNTLGLIEIKNDQPHRGRVHCERALGVFRDLGTPRGIGLACTGLAEAHRRCAEAPGVYSPAEQVERLRLAQEFAGQAVQIFREEVPERLRLVEALNEKGCVYRDWARIWPDCHEEQDPGRGELAQKGIEALQEAADLAADVFPYRQVDALVNLAWLRFYTNEAQLALQILDQAEKIVPEDYYITTEKGLPQVEDPIAFLWVQMGKAHLLRGQIALQRYWDTPPVKGQVRDTELLRQVVEHFTLALAYDELFADDFRDMRRAKDAMYRALRSVNVQEVKALYEGIKTTAKKYRLKHRRRKKKKLARPRMRNFLEEYFPLGKEGEDSA